MVDRVSNFSQTSRLISNNLRVEAEYARGQEQISSGLKSNSYEELARESRQILSLESEYRRLTTQSENAQTALNRTEVMYDSIGQMLNEAQGFLAQLNAAISGTSSSAEIQNQAQNSMELTQSSMNRQFEGRYLFAGSATQTAPVDITATGYGGALAPSTADTTYYQGNDYVQSVEISDGYTINYGVTADNAIFEEVLRAYDLVRTTPDDDATLNEAYTLLQGAVDSMSELRSQVSQDSTTIDRTINERLDELNLIDNMLADLREVDLAEVSIRLAELEVQLEASYSVTTDLLTLNLTDFLR